MATDSISAIDSISLPVNNMFANGRIIEFADGTVKLVRDRSQYVPIEPDDYYTVKIGDRITKIAYDYYKNKVLLPSHYWWIIVDANPALIRNPLDLSALKGKQIVIPNIINFKLNN